MTRTFFFLLLFLSNFILIVALLQSCKEPAIIPVSSNEQEAITTVKIEFKDTASGQFLNYYFRDMDRGGTNPPSQLDTIKLNANSTYLASIKFINEANPNAVINVTAEIKAEEKNHIICYSVTNSTIIIRTDSDGTYSLGLESKWFTGSASKGDLTISLKHQPGMKDGSCLLGTTDSEVKFPLVIK